MSANPDELPRDQAHAQDPPANDDEADDSESTSASDDASGSSGSSSEAADNDLLASQKTDEPSRAGPTTVASKSSSRTEPEAALSQTGITSTAARIANNENDEAESSNGSGDDSPSLASGSSRTGDNETASVVGEKDDNLSNKGKEIDTDQAVIKLNAMFGSDSESDGGSVERRRQRNRAEGQQVRNEVSDEVGQTAPESAANADAGGATLGDLFGSDAEDDAESDNEAVGIKRKSNAVAAASPAPSSAPSENLEIRRIREVEADEEDESKILVAIEAEPAQPEQQLVEVNIPFLDPELNQDDLVLLRNPKFFQIDSRPFTEEHYADGFADADENSDHKILDPVQIGLMKKNVENTVRWKENLSVDEEGNPVHLDESSNARIVEWSDGSYSLYVGEKYVGELSERPIDEHVHLFVEMSGQLHGTAVMKKKFLGKSDEVVSRGRGGTDSIVLTSSSALVAQKLARETKRVEYVGTTGKNPEMLRADLWKKEEERQKAATKRESAQRRVRERAHMRGISAKYLEGGAAGAAEGGGGEDEDEHTISLSKIKREANIKSRQFGRGAYDDDSEGEFDDFIAKGNEADDDDEDDFGSSRKRRKDRSRIGEASSAAVHSNNDRSIKKNPLKDEED